MVDGAVAREGQNLYADSGFDWGVAGGSFWGGD